ncbi:MAG: hypothetical protein Q9188_003798 [Gyalolechia gomerana]
MADPFSTVATVVSFADVTIRACKGIRAVIDIWKDAPNTTQHLPQTLQNQQFMLESLRLYVVEYESSKLFVEQHQLLPLVIKNVLRDISSDLNSLLDTCFILFHSIRSSALRVVLPVLTQLRARRNGIKIYEQVSSIRGDLQQSDAATANQLREAKSSISQLIGEAARDGSDKLSEQVKMLGSIQTLVEPVPDNYAKTIDRLEDLVTAMQLSAAHQRSSTTLEATSMDILRRLPRAELTSLVLPTVGEHLDSYESSQDAELKGIRKNLDRIVSVLGHPLLGDTLLVRHDAKGSQEPTVGYA